MSHSPSPLTASQKQAIGALKKNGLVDVKWYEKNYQDAAILGMNPLEHFVRYGLLLQRDPHPDVVLSFLQDAIPNLQTATPSETLMMLGADWVSQIDPGRVLWAASRLAETAGFERAIALAGDHLTGHQQNAIQILEANHAVVREDHTGWLPALNAYLTSHALRPLELTQQDGNFLAQIQRPDLPVVTQGPKVSVLMPVFKAEDTIRYAVQSILDQTWQNLEVIAVDDASPDGTWDVLKDMARHDPRLKVLRNAHNAGPYVAKNIALKIATGTYVTGHDSDDYALSERIERQVQFLEQNAFGFALSGMVRVQSNGYVTRINPAGLNTDDGVCTTAFISLMARRDLLEGIYGHWDEVRFGGDSELIRRIQTVEERIIPRLHVPTMLTLDHPAGLTNHETQGMSAQIRTTYRKRFSQWHKKLEHQSAYLPFPQAKRKFKTDPGMLNAAGSVAKLKAFYDTTHGDLVQPVTRCDVAIVTDLRFPGGNCSSTLDEAAFFRKQGLSVQLIKCPVDIDLRSEKAFAISERYADWGDCIKMWYDVGRLECRHLIIRHPLVVTSQAFARIRAHCTADAAHIVINNAPHNVKGQQIYSIEKMQAAFEAIPVAQKQIVPISVPIRKELARFLPATALASQNWSPTFDVADYANPPQETLQPPFRIGRHGRDGMEKWIEDAEALRLVYPDHSDFEVSILGGAKHAVKRMGAKPDNWTIHDFGAVTPRDYLHDLDIFAYFPNTKLQEAFGRTIVEAMISARPCILPARFAETFGDLAFYVDPENVADLVWALSENWGQCQKFLICVKEVAIANFASQAIATRLPDLIKITDAPSTQTVGLALHPEMLAFKVAMEKQAAQT